MPRLDESSPTWVRKRLLMERYAKITGTENADRAMLRDVLSILAGPELIRLTRAWLDEEERSQ